VVKELFESHVGFAPAGCNLLDGVLLRWHCD
jgi:hypothetical protein